MLDQKINFCKERATRVLVSPVFHQFISVGRRQSFRKTLRKQRKGCLCAISVKLENFSLKSSFNYHCSLTSFIYFLLPVAGSDKALNKIFFLFQR